MTEEETTEAVTEATTEATTEEVTFPYITLTSDSKSINVGEDFDPMSVIDEVEDDNDDRNSLFNRIDLEGEFDTNSAGTYNLIYSVRDSEGNRSKEVKFTLTVKEQ